METVVVFAGIAAVVGLLVFYGYKQQQKRTREMQATAERMGWSFAAEAPLSTVPGAERLPLFSQGRSRRIRNFLSGQRGGVRAAVFDYHYTTGSGKSSTHWNQTVVYLHSGRLDLPDFTLRPESFLHRIAGVFGYQDIDFPGHPLFSDRFLLRGGDEAAIRGVFHEGVLGFFEAEPGACADAQGNEVLFWRPMKMARPEEAGALLERGLDLLSRLESRGTVPAGGD